MAPQDLGKQIKCSWQSPQKCIGSERCLLLRMQLTDISGELASASQDSASLTEDSQKAIKAYENSTGDCSNASKNNKTITCLNSPDGECAKHFLPRTEIKKRVH